MILKWWLWNSCHFSVCLMFNLNYNHSMNNNKKNVFYLPNLICKLIDKKKKIRYHSHHFLLLLSFLLFSLHFLKNIISIACLSHHIFFLFCCMLKVAYICINLFLKFLYHHSFIMHKIASLLCNIYNVIKSIGISFKSFKLYVSSNFFIYLNVKINHINNKSN